MEHPSSDDTLDSLLDQIRNLVKNGKDYYALLIIDEALNLFPAEIPLRHLGASVCMRLGQYEQSRVHGRSILKLNPDHEYGYHAIVASYLGTSKPYDYKQPAALSEALQYANEGLAKHPGNHVLMLDRIRILLALKSYSEALRQCKSLLELYPDITIANLHAAECCLALNQFHECFNYVESMRNTPSLQNSSDKLVSKAKLSQLAHKVLTPYLDAITELLNIGSRGFDEIVSLGRDCRPAFLISSLGYRSEALPFDWTICPDHTLLEILRGE